MYVRDIEEADKICFYGREHNNEENIHVTDDNLIKTKEFLGYQAYLVCKEKNISSRWSDLENKAKNFYLPQDGKVTCLIFRQNVWLFMD